MGWCAGLLVGVYRRPPDGRKLPVAGFAFVTLVAVIGVTVPASHWISGLLAQYVPGSESWNAQNLFLPVAAAIPAIGHNWADVGLRLYHLLRRRLPKEG
jgi:hypothetical protein